jgi:hypothetical protein
MKDTTFDWCAARAAAQLTRWVLVEDFLSGNQPF